MIVVFDKNFYKIKAVENSIRAYQDLALFNIEETANNIKVKISKIDQDVKKIIKDEFCNYVLAETNKINQKCL